jgi:hypothetical protein
MQLQNIYDDLVSMLKDGPINIDEVTDYALDKVREAYRIGVATGRSEMDSKFQRRQ